MVCRSMPLSRALGCVACRMEGWRCVGARMGSRDQAQVVAAREASLGAVEEADFWETRLEFEAVTAAVVALLEMETAALAVVAWRISLRSQ